MSDKFKVVYYLNQFFGQIGGEDKAGIEPFSKDKAIGPAGGFDNLIGDKGEVVATVICGDNYFNENTDAVNTVLDMIKEYNPDLVIAGPAFNAGRYGVACAEVSKVVEGELNIPVITAMYHENPAVDSCKKEAYIVETSDSAAGMRDALPRMAAIAKKLAAGEPLGPPEEEGYIPQGRRVTLFSDKKGSTRAVEMLLARLNDEEFETELPMPDFDFVDPADAVDLSEANIALVTTGGVVPEGNPDRIESASASKYKSYSVKDLHDFEQVDFITIHGGYDPVYVNEDYNRVIPFDILKQKEDKGIIAKIHDKFYTTTGTGTAVGNAEEFGKKIGKELSDDGVDAVILTST